MARLLLLLASLLALACDDLPAASFVEPAYADPCKFLECGNGVCHVTESGAPECLCAVGYQGDQCDRCEPGFHRDSLDRCVADKSCAEQPANPCAPAGLCKEDEGVLGCACDTGYEGPRCTLCADRYARDPLDRCLPVYLVEGASGDAGSSMPPPSMSCPTGYTGTNCNQCSMGHHAVMDHCVVDEVCRPTSCPPNSTCQVNAGVVSCTCDQGYAGPSCTRCAEGYHKWEGECVIDEVCTPGACPEHATCQVRSGLITCACTPGYSGEACDSCSPTHHREGEACVSNVDCRTGYHKLGDVCVPDQVCEVTSCPEHATCTVVNGLVTCPCDPGWGPAPSCNLCSAYATERSGFEYPEGWATAPNHCLQRLELAVSKVTFSSRVTPNGAEGPVWLCAKSTYSKMSSQHIEIEAYAGQPGVLIFDKPASTVVFDYGSRLEPLAVDVFAYDNPTADMSVGGRQVASLTLAMGMRATLTLQLSPEPRALALRSRNGKHQFIALDELVYTYPDCD